MKLVSDFRDYYDAAFDGIGKEFRRIAVGSGPTRRQQHDILEAAGYKVPLRGTFAEMNYLPRLVVYKDESAHCTDGKQVWEESGWDLMWEQPPSDEDYSVQFVGKFNEKSATSWRYLQIGRHQFWIEYTSNESWMSNYGDGDIQIIGVDLNAGYHPLSGIDSPLYAIDFVIADDMYAVDLNIAPGLKGTGVNKYLTPKEVVEALESI